MAQSEQSNSVDYPPGTLKEMLEEVPLHSIRKVEELFYGAGYERLDYPRSIWMHCDDENCDGKRRHSLSKHDELCFGELLFYHYVIYACEDCRDSIQTFGFKAIRKDETSHSGLCLKIYQEPAFGTPIPKRLFHVIGKENREYFLQARRAIGRGLGIGAFGYYRRIVENTKFDLVTSVLEVAEATNAPATQVQVLKKAQAERQFSKAIEMLRDVSAIPAVLLIDGRNPLALLHDTLSEGIHELSDQECLERAQDAEIVLCELANRMQLAMTEHKTVKTALSNILKRKVGAPTSPKPSDVN